MPILIDGWNFIRDRNSILKNREPLEAVKVLIGYLVTFQITHNDPILLILDSKSECLPIFFRDSAKLQIVPTPDADNFIKRYIDKTPANHRKNIRVVSSDLEIFDYSRSSQAIAIKCAEFWKKIKPRS